MVVERRETSADGCASGEQQGFALTLVLSERERWNSGQRGGAARSPQRKAPRCPFRCPCLRNTTGLGPSRVKGQSLGGNLNRTRSRPVVKVK